MSEEDGVRAGAGEGDADPAGGLGDAGGDLEKPEPDRGELGLGEGMGLGDGVAHGAVQTATNLYLYGTLETPGTLYDRIYPADYEGGEFGGPRVLVDAVSYMADGPGRYATPSLAPAVEDFFFELSGVPIEPGEYSRSYIQNLYGYDPFKENGDPFHNGFRFALSQYELQKGTADYDKRTYVYNTGDLYYLAIGDRAVAA